MESGKEKQQKEKGFANHTKRLSVLSIKSLLKRLYFPVIVCDCRVLDAKTTDAGGGLIGKRKRGEYTKKRV